MARGWESKSVEEQQAQREESPGNPKPQLTPNERARMEARNGLLLNRKRVVQQLEAVQNQQHRAMLQQALAHLDTEIAALDSQ